MRPMEITLTGYDSGLEAWVSKEQEQMQSALLPSLNLYGSLCIENHNLFFFTRVMAEMDLEGELCKEDCRGPGHSSSL